MIGLLVADHLRQEIDEIGGLNHRTAILAVPQGRESRLPGDADVPSACGTGVIGRDSGLSNLVDEIIHIHVDLGHDLSSTVPPDLTGFLPHPELLEDAGRRLVVFRLDQVSNLRQLLSSPEVFGHRDRASRGPRMKSNSAKDVFLTEHDGRVSSGDECPSPAVEALPRANRMIGRNGRRTRQRGFPGSPGSGHVGICVARDHLAVLAQIGSAHHATGSAQTPAAEATAFAFSQSVRFSGLHPLVSED